MKPVYSVSEVAKHLKVTRLTIIKLIKQGKIKAFRMGKVYRIEEDSINELLANKEVVKDEPAREAVSQ